MAENPALLNLVGLPAAKNPKAKTALKDLFFSSSSSSPCCGPEGTPGWAETVSSIFRETKAQALPRHLATTRNCSIPARRGAARTKLDLVVCRCYVLSARPSVRPSVRPSGRDGGKRCAPAQRKKTNQPGPAPTLATLEGKARQGSRVRGQQQEGRGASRAGCARFFLSLWEFWYQYTLHHPLVSTPPPRLGCNGRREEEEEEDGDGTSFCQAGLSGAAC